MEDFKMILLKLAELMSIEIPVFGFKMTFLSIFIGMSVMSIVIGFVVKIFGGGD